MKGAASAALSLSSKTGSGAVFLHINLYEGEEFL